MANTSSTAANIIQYAASFLNQFAQRNFPDSKRSDKDKFVVNINDVFSSHVLIEELWGEINLTLSTSYTEISNRKPGHLLFWSDNSDYGIGVVLPDITKMLVLNSSVSKLKEEAIQGRTYLGGVDITEFTINDRLDIVNPNVIIPYSTLTPQFRAIRGNLPTGQLTGIIILQEDVDVVWGGAFPNLMAYANAFRQNIVTFWESQFIGTLPSVQTRVNSTGVQTLTRNTFLSTFITPSSQSVNLLQEVDFFIDTNPNDPITASDISSNIYADRIVLIKVGNGTNSIGSRVSHVTLAANTTGYMYLSNGAQEAAHEFGHLCGLEDRYVEAVVYDDSFSLIGDNSFNHIKDNKNASFPLFQRGKADAFIPLYSAPDELNYNLNPANSSPIYPYRVLMRGINRLYNPPVRKTLPIVLPDDTNYNYLTNLMSAPNMRNIGLSSLTPEQLSIVHNNTHEVAPFRVDFYIPLSEFGRSKYDGIELVYSDVSNDNSPLRDIQLSDIIPWKAKNTPIPIPSPLSIAERNATAIVAFNQWFKLFDLQNPTFAPAPTYNQNKNLFIIGRWKGILPVSSNTFDDGTVTIRLFHKQTDLLTSQQGNTSAGTPANPYPNYIFWAADNHISNLSNIDAYYQRLAPADIMSHAVRWMIENQHNTPV